MNYPITSARLQSAMAKNGMKAAELAVKSGVGKSSVSQYVNGSHKPSNKTAYPMGEVLNVNPLWLMGFDVPEDRTIFLYSKLSDRDKAKVQGYIEKMLEDNVYKKVSMEVGEVV